MIAYARVRASPGCPKATKGTPDANRCRERGTGGPAGRHDRRRAAGGDTAPWRRGGRARPGAGRHNHRAAALRPGAGTRERGDPAGHRRTHSRRARRGAGTRQARPADAGPAAQPDRRPGARPARPGRRQRRALGAGRRPRGPRRRGDRAHPRRGLRARPLPLRPVPHPRAGQAARIGDGTDHRRDLGAAGKRGGPRRGAGRHPRRGAELHARPRQLARQPDDPERRRRAAPRPAPTNSASSAR